MGIILSEPAIVPDIFCSGLADAEDMGDGNMRFTLFSRQKSLHDYAGTFDLIVVARLIMPMSAVHVAMQMTMKVAGPVAMPPKVRVIAH